MPSVPVRERCLLLESAIFFLRYEYKNKGLPPAQGKPSSILFNSLLTGLCHFPLADEHVREEVSGIVQGLTEQAIHSGTGTGH